MTFGKESTPTPIRVIHTGGLCFRLRHRAVTSPSAYNIALCLKRVSGVYELAHAEGSCLEEPAMPTYEYRCQKCGKVFDREEHIAEHAKSHPSCPKCKSEAIQPVLADFFAKTSKKS
jgi:putative FmdB family regulatory protein